MSSTIADVTDDKSNSTDADETMKYVCFEGRFDSPINTSEDMIKRRIERMLRKVAELDDRRQQLVAPLLNPSSNWWERMKCNGQIRKLNAELTVIHKYLKKYQDELQVELKMKELGRADESRPIQTKAVYRFRMWMKGIKVPRTVSPEVAFASIRRHKVHPV